MRFLKFVDMNPDGVVELSPDDASSLVQEYVDHLADRGLSIRTVNVTLAYLKVFFRVNDFKGDRELEVERYHQPTRYRKRPEYIPTPEEIYRMAYSSGSTRNRAIVLSLYTSGLRNSTLRGLRIGDVIDELEDGLEVIRVPVYPEMKELVGDACKGLIPHYSFLSRESTEALREYLNERTKTYREVSGDEPLFCADSPNYEPELSRKTPVKKRTLTEVVKRAARKAGIEQWKSVSPHCLRKAFESALRNNRLDTKDQEFLMGHILSGSQDAYYDRSKIETLRNKYARVVFFPERAFSNEALRRKQLLDTAKMLGFEDDKLMKFQEILARAKTVDEAVDEFRKLRTETM